MDMLLPVEKLKGVGPKTAASLRDSGIVTLSDLLYCLPRTYENYQTAVTISQLRPGKVMLKGKISDIKTSRTRRRNLSVTEAIIRDDTGAIRTVWFNQPYRAKQFDKNREYYFTGNYEFKNGRYALMSPSATLVQDVAGGSGFQPLYSKHRDLTPKIFRRLIANLEPSFADIPDLLPLTSGAPSYLTPGARAEALFSAHFPANATDAERGRHYLAYEELFELILAAKLNKQENLRLPAVKLPFQAAQTRTLVASLPFQLTNAQRRAAWDILQELGRDLPMNRLLQGDVGSGKTVVAALAAAQAAAAGHQTAILAPTAILATQHYESFVKLFAGLKSKGIAVPTVALLTGATRAKPKLKADIANGKIDLVIGTHALLTDDTTFHSLALCVIDEQHRFGVAQRKKLLLKSPDGLAPHLLSMTATPIPRSLQLTLFGDLDVSLLNELPAGRQPIKTTILSETACRDELYPAMRQLLAEHQQIYWICQAIDEDNRPLEGRPAVASAKKQAKKLAEIFDKHRVGLLHGQMKSAEKDAVMTDFAAGKIDILVSTTVVEVGVNVPNANMIIIQDAEHFGLAQLHQLRGRVGRGDQPASCFLLINGEARPSRRLKELEKSTDGFHLAEVDLKLRGPGEIYGALQHGELNLQIASLSDTKTIAEASHHAAEFAKHPEDMVKYPELAKRIQKYQQLTTLN